MRIASSAGICRIGRTGQDGTGRDWSGCDRIGVFIYHAAPTTESPMQSAMPRSAHAYGDIDSRKAPTYF